MNIKNSRNNNVNNLLRTPGNLWIYWKNIEGIYLGCNDFMAEQLNLSSRHDIQGKTDYDLNVLKKEADYYRAVDQKIVKTGLARQLQDTATLTDAKLEFLVMKTPLYQDDKISGIIGFSYCYKKQNINEFSKQSPLSNTVINGVSLSPREIQILHLLARGKIAKQIADNLGLSPRTIEHYIVNIRKKFKAYSKSDLVEKVIDHFLF